MALRAALARRSKDPESCTPTAWANSFTLKASLPDVNSPTTSNSIQSQSECMAFLNHFAPFLRLRLDGPAQGDSHGPLLRSYLKIHRGCASPPSKHYLLCFTHVWRLVCFRCLTTTKCQSLETRHLPCTRPRYVRFCVPEIAGGDYIYPIGALFPI